MVILMVSIRILHFIGLLLLLLAVTGVDCGNYCWSKECSTEDVCRFPKTKKAADDKCGFVLVLDRNCSFIGAMGASYNQTGEYVKHLNHSSSMNLTIVSYTTTWKSIHPALIVSNQTDQSSKWSLEETFANSSGCNYEINKILCTLLADPDIVSVNKTMCPDPTTTTRIPSTTVHRTTNGREMVTKEATSTERTKSSSTVDETFQQTTTTEESPLQTWSIWAIILMCLSPLVLLAAAVFAFLAWRKKLHKSADAKKKEEKNKEEKAPEAAPSKNTEQKEEGDYGALNRTNPDVARILERSKKRDPAALAAILASSRALLDAGNPYVREMNLKMDSSEAGLKQMMRRVSALSQNGFDGKPIPATNEEGEKVEFYKALPAKYQKEMAPRKRRTSEQQRKIIADLKMKKAQPKEEKPKEEVAVAPKEVAVAPKEEETNKGK